MRNSSAWALMIWTMAARVSARVPSKSKIRVGWTSGPGFGETGRNGGRGEHLVYFHSTEHFTPAAADGSNERTPPRPAAAGRRPARGPWDRLPRLEFAQGQGPDHGQGCRCRGGPRGQPRPGRASGPPLRSGPAGAGLRATPPQRMSDFGSTRSTARSRFPTRERTTAASKLARKSGRRG